MNKELITLKNISMKYQEQWVLQSINHRAASGDSVTFTGKNGCGKSTLLKIIAGLLTPSQGTIERRGNLRFSYVPEKFTPVKMTAREFLWHMAEIEGMKKAEIDRTVVSWSEEFFIGEMLDVSMHALSKGTLQKVNVIQAFLQQSDVLLLDEPLSGQDRESQKVFIDKVNQLREKGTAIFMSCHEPYLMHAVSDHVYTIVNGKLENYVNQYMPCCILTLENPGGLSIWPDMKPGRNDYQMKVQEGQVQEILLKLLSEGWIVKEMIQDDTTGKI